MRPLIFTFALACSLVTFRLPAPLAVRAQLETPALRVYADAQNNVHVVPATGKESVVASQKDQVGVDQIKIAADNDRRRMHRAATHESLPPRPMPGTSPLDYTTTVAFPL